MKGPPPHDANPAKAGPGPWARESLSISRQILKLETKPGKRFCLPAGAGWIEGQKRLNL
jgi:hypothetical protein